MVPNIQFALNKHCLKTLLSTLLLFIPISWLKIQSSELRSTAMLMRRRQWHPTPVLLPGKSHGGAWWAAVHGVAKSQTWPSDFTFTFHFHALEKEMATHSSVPAWRIPGTGEPGRLPSVGSHRVWHDWSDLAAVAAAMLMRNGSKNEKVRHGKTAQNRINL